MRLFRTSQPGGDVADALELPPPPVTSAKMEPKIFAPVRDGYLQEYADLAKCVGVTPPDLTIEAFKDFLRRKDWGVFSLSEVVAYMDDKAAKESAAKAGWHWCPLRESDNIIGAEFGTSARVRNSHSFGIASEMTPASDYYLGPQEKELRVANVAVHLSGGGGGAAREMTHYLTTPSARPYDKTIPLHALRKVATIEKEFTHDKGVAFFVCDYAPMPHIEHPDPFLMAVIANSKLATGVGRFIIDFWDEPGFGIEQMLKA